MKKYIKDSTGETHKIDFYCHIEDGKTWVMIDDRKDCHLKVYYRPERTWNDHMGNTECGYYCIVPIGNERRRVYMF